MKLKIMRLGLVILVVLAVPTAVVLGRGPHDVGKGHEKAASHATHPGEGKAEDADKSEAAGERPHNHGWFVSQAAKDHSLTGSAHGEAVSTVAQSDAGKPEAAH